jgi:hypothetical protein
VPLCHHWLNRAISDKAREITGASRIKLSLALAKEIASGELSRSWIGKRSRSIS